MLSMWGCRVVVGYVLGIMLGWGVVGVWMGMFADWAFDHELQVGERIVFEDMIHYTMVKTTMFNGVAHPAIAVADADGAVRIVREFGYADFKGRMS